MPILHLTWKRKMASARGSNKDGPIPEYEQERLTRIATNKKRLEALKLLSMSTILPQRQTKKRTKRTHNRSDATSEGHNLRPRPQRNQAENANQIGEDLDCESIGDNVEIISQNGSNSRPQSQSPRSKEHVDEAHHDAECEDNDEDNYDQFDEDQFLLARRCSATLSVLPRHQSHQVSPTSATPSVPPPHQSHQVSPTSTAPSGQARNDAPRSPHDDLVGKDVILYAMLRSDLPVAKGTVISTNPTTMLGGQVLGKQFCEVIVNLVLKRDAILPRPYAEMNSMADAHMMSIAWPYRRLKVGKASKSG